jgi:hypothetical protein
MELQDLGTVEEITQQLQAWDCGTGPSGVAIVILVNMGPGVGGSRFNTTLSGMWTQRLGLKYKVIDVWKGTDLGVVGKKGVS